MPDYKTDAELFRVSEFAFITISQVVQFVLTFLLSTLINPISIWANVGSLVQLNLTAAELMKTSLWFLFVKTNWKRFVTNFASLLLVLGVAFSSALFSLAFPVTERYTLSAHCNDHCMEIFVNNSNVVDISRGKTRHMLSHVSSLSEAIKNDSSGREAFAFSESYNKVENTVKDSETDSKRIYLSNTLQQFMNSEYVFDISVTSASNLLSEVRIGAMSNPKLTADIDILDRHRYQNFRVLTYIYDSVFVIDKTVSQKTGLYKLELLTIKTIEKNNSTLRKLSENDVGEQYMFSMRKNNFGAEFETTTWQRRLEQDKFIYYRVTGKIRLLVLSGYENSRDNRTLPAYTLIEGQKWGNQALATYQRKDVNCESVTVMPSDVYQICVKTRTITWYDGRSTTGVLILIAVTLLLFFVSVIFRIAMPVLIFSSPAEYILSSSTILPGGCTRQQWKSKVADILFKPEAINTALIEIKKKPDEPRVDIVINGKILKTGDCVYEPENLTGIKEFLRALKTVREVTGKEECSDSQEGYTDNTAGGQPAEEEQWRLMLESQQLSRLQSKSQTRGL